MENRITDIRCLSCGAPAQFDIIHQKYVCGHCGGTVSIDEAQKQKQGFRKIRQDALRESVQHFHLLQASCRNCGAELVFEENEALTVCPFCHTSMVRRDYLYSDLMPESVIPFALTAEEAEQRLAEWCSANKGKKEAATARRHLKQLKGFYLPYELVQGPVYMKTGRMDSFSSYQCEGCVREAFISRSSQTDNLLLDGMEPFDTDALTEFDFGYIAGQRVKTADLEEKVLIERIQKETAETYAPKLAETLETRAIETSVSVSSMIRFPVLLPVYYLYEDGLMAAVNGQTGKVSVRAMEDSHYYFLPWWFKAVIAAVLICGAVCGGLMLFGMETYTALMITGMLAIVMLIITLCYYSDTVHNAFRVISGRKIYTSGAQSFKRENGELVLRDSLLERQVDDPVFYADVQGKSIPAVLKFTTPYRIVRMIVLALCVIFLPVLIAWVLRGFDFRQLEPGGSAVWFCVAVPVVPVYLLKYGIAELHDRPWIYPVTEQGVSHKRADTEKTKITWAGIKEVLRFLFIPPEALILWFGILCFCMCVYLTAFGFD